MTRRRTDSEALRRTTLAAAAVGLVLCTVTLRASAQESAGEKPKDDWGRIASLLDTAQKLEERIPKITEGTDKARKALMERVRALIRKVGGSKGDWMPLVREIDQTLAGLSGPRGPSKEVLAAKAPGESAAKSSGGAQEMPQKTGTSTEDSGWKPIAALLAAAERLTQRISKLDTLDEAARKKEMAKARKLIEEGDTGPKGAAFAARVRRAVKAVEAFLAPGSAEKALASASAAGTPVGTADKRTDKLADKKTDKLPDKRTDKLADKKTDKLPDKRTDKLADKKTDKLADKKTDKLADKKTDKLADKKTDKLDDKKTESDDEVPIGKQVSVATMAKAAKEKASVYRPLLAASTGDATLLDKPWSAPPALLLNAVIASEALAAGEAPDEKGRPLSQAIEKKEKEATGPMKLVASAEEIRLVDEAWSQVPGPALATMSGAKGGEEAGQSDTEAEGKALPLSAAEMLLAGAEKKERGRKTLSLAANPEDAGLLDRVWSDRAVPKVARAPLVLGEIRLAAADEPLGPLSPVPEPLPIAAASEKKVARKGSKWWSESPEDTGLLDKPWSAKGRLLALSTPPAEDGPVKPVNASDVSGPLAGVVPVHLLEPEKEEPLAKRRPLNAEEKQLLAGALPPSKTPGTMLAREKEEKEEKEDPKRMAELLKTDVKTAPSRVAAVVSTTQAKASDPLAALAGKGGGSNKTSASTKASSNEEKSLLSGAGNR